MKIELSGARIRCYLDGRLIHDATVPQPQNFFAVSGMDAAHHELVLKAINLGAEAVSARFDLKNLPGAVDSARAIVLKSDSLLDNNSLEEPERVVPVAEAVAISGSALTREFPPRSLTVLPVKCR